MAVSLYCRKFKIGPFLAKNNQNVAIFDQKTPFLSSFDLILTLTFLYSIFYLKYFQLSPFSIFSFVLLPHVTKLFDLIMTGNLFGLEESRRPMDSRTYQIFLMRPWLYKCKKWPFRFIVENSKLALFWPKTIKMWPFLTKKLHFFQVLT